MKNNDDNGADTRTGIESIETGIGLLFCFITLGGRSHKLKVLAEAADMPPSKAHRYLVSFMRMGLVERESVNGHYRLGPKAAELGAVALDALDPLALSVEAMMELREELGHTFVLTVWGTAAPVIIRVEEADRVMSINVRVGKSLPMLNTAAGQLFAAYLPRATTQAALAAEIEANKQQRDGRVVRSLVQAERLLSEVRARGMSRNDSYLPGISSLAAPVLNKHGNLVAAISAVGATGSFDMNWTGPIATALRKRSLEVGHRLGFEDTTIESEESALAKRGKGRK